MIYDLPLVLITGASGFVGGALVEEFKRLSSFRVRGSGRKPDSCHLDDYHTVNLEEKANWEPIVAGVDTVIHCAARVHVMRDFAVDSLGEFRRANVEGTLVLARQAAAAGVRRFVFLSSIKVNGESTVSRKPFCESDEVSPEDAYGISKWEAELGLRSLADATGMELVIIRPPLVYGPGVKGNFLSLLKLARSGLPLPLGAIHNHRSMIYLGNLVDLIVRCVVQPAAANQLFLAADGRDLSTTELLCLMRQGMKVPVRLIPVPQTLLQLAGRVVGKSEVFERLCGSLQVDSSKANSVLGWSPPYTVESGLQATVAAFENLLSNS